eukprot:4244843-Amphidinium_carterae.1
MTSGSMPTEPGHRGTSRMSRTRGLAPVDLGDLAGLAAGDPGEGCRDAPPDRCGAQTCGYHGPCSPCQPSLNLVQYLHPNLSTRRVSLDINAEPRCGVCKRLKFCPIW